MVEDVRPPYRGDVRRSSRVLHLDALLGRVAAGRAVVTCGGDDGDAGRCRGHEHELAEGAVVAVEGLLAVGDGGGDDLDGLSAGVGGVESRVQGNDGDGQRVDLGDRQVGQLRGDAGDDPVSREASWSVASIGLAVTWVTWAVSRGRP